jgi:apolipoprotein N-acyltransferase
VGLFLNGSAIEGSHPGGDRRRKGLTLALTVVSSLLVVAAFPPYDLGFAAWFGLAPFLCALRMGGRLESALLGFLFGILYMAGTMHWTLSIAAFRFSDFCICAVFLGLYFLLFGVLYRRISGKAAPWALIVAPSLWVAMEYVRSNLSFLSFPWNLLGHSQHMNLPVLQIADITGVYGISFLVVMVNEFVSRLPERFGTHRGPYREERGLPLHKTGWAIELAMVCASLALALGYGGWKLSIPVNAKRIRVAIVQGNAVVQDNMTFAKQMEHYRVYEELTRQAAAAKPDLIAWPSSSITAPITDRLSRFTVIRLARASGTYLLVGGAGHQKDRPRREGDLPYSNSEFLFSPAGRLERQYNKIRLTPFNEYLPLRDTFPWPGFVSNLRADYLAGTEHVVFPLPGGSFGTPICWENLFPESSRRLVEAGAQFIVAVTNEAFFRGSAALHRQTLAMNVFRAVENRVAVVRVATTGISAFIHPDGNIVDRVRAAGGKDLDVSGVLVRDIPLARGKTFYTVYGDLFAFASIGVAGVAFLASLADGIRNRFRETNRGEG